jgi:hypothetical protein
MQFAIFFNNERPKDIGLSGAFLAFSNEVLGSILGLDPKILDVLPNYQKDLFVVARSRMNAQVQLSFIRCV